ncbi:MAG: restriction endonuclease subunit S [Candidatus Zixiibacteriota bacterium]
MSSFQNTSIGTMPSEWEIIPLTKAIGKYIDNRGKTVPVTNKPTKMVLIATNCIKEDSIFPVKEKIRYVADDIYENWFRAHPEPGDIIIVNKGTPGLVCFVPNKIDFCIAQDMIAMRPDPKVMNNKYLFAYMRSRKFKWQVSSLNVGTTIPHLKKTNFAELLIPKPTIKEQELIGEFYFSLSSKIELLRRQNETLEKIAQTIFKEWFVEFNFPDKNGKPYKANGGKMIDSELGEIPDGWRVGRISDTFHMIGGGTPKTSVAEYWNGDIPWFSIVDAPSESDVFVINTEKTITKLGLDKSSTKVLPVGATVISARGTVGRCAIVGHEMAFNQSCYGVIAKDHYSHYWVYLTVKDRVAALINSGHGSVFNTITRETFDSIRIPVPDSQITQSLDDVISSSMSKIKQNLWQMQTLTRLRDTLLPKLMSGQVRVKDATKIIGRTT